MWRRRKLWSCCPLLYLFTSSPAHSARYPSVGQLIREIRDSRTSAHCTALYCIALHSTLHTALHCIALLCTLHIAHYTLYSAQWTELYTAHFTLHTEDRKQAMYLLYCLLKTTLHTAPSTVQCTQQCSAPSNAVHPAVQCPILSCPWNLNVSIHCWHNLSYCTDILNVTYCTPKSV